MTSRGIDTYISLSSPAFTARLDVRGNSPAEFQCAVDNGFPVIQRRHHELYKSSLGFFEKSGRYTIRVSQNGQEVFAPYAEIDPSTGSTVEGNFADMLRTSSVVTPDRCISYGFFEADSGEWSQAYISVTDNRSDWMSKLLIRYPALRQKPLGTFVLPGSHDAGMFCGIDSNDQANYLLTNLAAHKAKQVASKFIDWADGSPAKAAGVGVGVGMGVVAAALMGGALSLSALRMLTKLKEPQFCRRLLINFAYTQKDDIATQLALGARHFDFRPGRMVGFARNDNELRRQHAFVPGYAFKNFLSDVVNFLHRNEQEIVVINTKFDGFYERDMLPTQPDLDRLIAKALAVGSGPSLQCGGLADYARTLDDLLRENRRLIVIRDDEGRAIRDSYDDTAYATDDPSTITAKLDKTLAISAQNVKLTILQLQGTYTGVLNNVDRVEPYVCSSSDAHSPLLRTKPRFDLATYQWLRQNVAGIAAIPATQGVVLLNDFFDNTLSLYAAQLTLKRAGLA